MNRIFLFGISITTTDTSISSKKDSRKMEASRWKQRNKSLKFEETPRTVSRSRLVGAEEEECREELSPGRIRKCPITFVAARRFFSFHVSERSIVTTVARLLFDFFPLSLLSPRHKMNVLEIRRGVPRRLTFHFIIPPRTHSFWPAARFCPRPCNYYYRTWRVSRCNGHERETSHAFRFESL